MLTLTEVLVMNLLTVLQMVSNALESNTPVVDIYQYLVFLAAII